MSTNSGQVFVQTNDYEVPLLRLLSRLINGQGETNEVCRLFEIEYRQHIPPEHYETQRGNEPMWRNNVRWCRKYLKDRGFLDPSTYGIWRITEAGRDWLSQNPSATRISGKRKSTGGDSRSTPTAKPARAPEAREERAAAAPAMPGITLQMLEQTRQTMPAEEFRETWGALYDQLLAADRAKVVTEVSQTELGRRSRQHLDKIHAFLHGRNTGSPSAEVLCDWIHFCYALELYREASALFPFLGHEETDAAAYRRAKRVADACRSRLSR